MCVCVSVCVRACIHAYVCLFLTGKGAGCLLVEH